MPDRTGDAARNAHALRSRDFTLVLIATFGAISNYAPLLSVVPLLAAHGGAGGTGLGATTGVVMATTVVSQLCMGRLTAMLSLRRLLAIGAALMGLPTPLYACSDQLAAILAVSAVRGIGFGMVVVAGSALTAELIPAELLGKGVGWYGMSTSLPNVVCVPLGVWAAQELGFAPVFAVTTVLALLAVPVILGVGERGPSRADPAGSIAAAAPARPRSVRRLAPTSALMLAGSIGLGGISTFLPLALANPALASLALLCVSIGVVCGRVGTGAVSDVIGAGRMLLPAVIVAATGMAGLCYAAYDPGPVAPPAALAYGLGWGAVQNDTLVVMLRLLPGGNALVSTVWNMAFDGGTGLGAVLLGGVVAMATEQAAFGVSATLIALTIPAAWHSRRARMPSR